MNNKISIMLAVLMLSLYPMTAYAETYPGSQPAPVPVQVNYIIATDTDFTVTTATGQTAMNFAGDKNSQGIEPTGQNTAATPPVAWATITNGGTYSQSFSAYLDTANPTGVVLYISNNPDMSGNITVSTTAQAPNGWLDVAPQSSIKLYAKASFTEAVDGTYSKTLSISTAPISAPPPPIDEGV